MFRQDLTRQILWGVLVVGVTVTADLATKTLAYRFEENPVELFGGFIQLVFTENSGASFSILQGQGTLLALIATVAVVITVVAITRPRPLVEVVAFGMLAGGALGNLANRLFRGEGWFDGRVIDWIRFPNFPDFNLADSAITIGVILLLWSVWIGSAQRSRQERELLADPQPQTEISQATSIPSSSSADTVPAHPWSESSPETPTVSP